MRILNRFLFLILVIGTFSCEDTREVILYDKGTSDASASATSIESGETVTFTATATKGYSYLWTFPSGTPESSTEASI